MPLPAPSSAPRRAGVVATVAAAVAVLLLSPSFGRAEPTGNYRPDLPPDALATGCFPLPGGAELDLAHQVRDDRDVLTLEGHRRRLTLQYDVVDRAEAERRVVAAFAAVGFVAERGDEPDTLALTRGAQAVHVLVEEIPGTSAETLVRGWILLDLPVTQAVSDAAVCGDPRSTKRWADGSRS